MVVFFQAIAASVLLAVLLIATLLLLTLRCFQPGVPACVSSLNAPTAASGDTRVRGRVNTRCWVCRGTTQLYSLPLNGGCFTSPLRLTSRGEVWAGGLVLTPCLVPHSCDATSCREAAPSSSCSTDALVDSAVLPAPTFTLASEAARRQCRLHVELSSSTKPPGFRLNRSEIEGSLPDGYRSV